MNSISLSSLSPFKEPRIDSEESIPRNRFHQSMQPGRAVTTNRVFVPARQARNRFLGSLKGLQIRALAGRYTSNIGLSYRPWLRLAGVIGSLESIPGLLNVYKFGFRSDVFPWSDKLPFQPLFNNIGEKPVSDSYPAFFLPIAATSNKNF